MNSKLEERITKLDGMLRRIAAKYAYDLHDADDIYGEIVINILEHSSPEDSNARIYTRAMWAGQRHAAKVQTINRNVPCVCGDGDTLTFERSTENEAIVNEDHIYSKEIIASCQSAEANAISAEMEAALLKAISSLPKRHQRIVAMLYSGSNQVEIAKELQVTPSAINQTLRTIREFFSAQGFSPSFA